MEGRGYDAGRGESEGLECCTVGGRSENGGKPARRDIRSIANREFLDCWEGREGPMGSQCTVI